MLKLRPSLTRRSYFNRVGSVRRRWREQKVGTTWWEVTWGKTGRRWDPEIYSFFFRNFVSCTSLEVCLQPQLLEVACISSSVQSKAGVKKTSISISAHFILSKISSYDSTEKEKFQCYFVEPFCRLYTAAIGLVLNEAYNVNHTVEMICMSGS